MPRPGGSPAMDGGSARPIEAGSGTSECNESGRPAGMDMVGDGNSGPGDDGSGGGGAPPGGDSGGDAPVDDSPMDSAATTVSDSSGMS